MTKYLLKDVLATESPLLNDNILVVGASGSGKTSLFVDTQIKNSVGSIVVSDTKSNLYMKYKADLENRGYKVILIDFNELDKSTYGYNPMERLAEQGENYCIEDVRDIAYVICPDDPREREPFWTQAARMMIEAYIMLTLEMLASGKVQPNLRTVAAFLSDISIQNAYAMMFEDGDNLSEVFRSFCWLIKIVDAEKMMASIYQYVHNSMICFDTDKMFRFFTRDTQIDFMDIAEKKTALFLNVSDNNRTNDKLVSLFYTQMFQELIRYADTLEDRRLHIPVNVIMDDFATNTFIAGFEDTISVIRSRGIAVSIILQSLSQLKGKYKESAAMTIINNCDRCVYLGANDVQLIDYISQKADRQVSSLLNLPLDTAIVFERGQEPREIKKQFEF